VTIIRAFCGTAALGFDGATLGGPAAVGATDEAAALDGADVDDGSSREHEAIPPLMINATTINAPVRPPTAPIVPGRGAPPVPSHVTDGRAVSSDVSRTDSGLGR
jgi:hypothetical protein